MGGRDRATGALCCDRLLFPLDSASADSQRHMLETPLRGGSATDDLPPRTYPSRWYIAAVWAWFGAISAFAWDLYAPVQGPVTNVFGWSDDEINWLSNGNNLAVVCTSPMWAWLADTKGIRPTAQLASAVFLASMLLPLLLVPHGLVPQRYSLLPAMASEVLNGASATAQNFLPPLISAVWFPESERTTATALMYEANIFGWMLCFVVPSWLVPEHASVDVQRAGIVILWQICAAGAIVFAVAVWYYFPNKPPTPPSVSAVTEKIEFTTGMRKIAGSGQFWIIVACFAIPNGFQQAWSSALDIIIGPFGFDQQLASRMGFWSVGAGAFAGVVLSVFADRFQRRMKLLISCMFCLATAGFFVFCLICIGVLPHSHFLIFGSVVIGVAAMSATNPLFLELAVETCYPVGEGLVSMSLIMFINLINVIYLAIPVDELGTRWQGWAVVVATPAATMLLLFYFDEVYRRSDADAAHSKVKGRASTTAGSE